MNISVCTFLCVHVCALECVRESVCQIKVSDESRRETFLDADGIRLQADDWSDLKLDVMCFVQLIEQRRRLRADAEEAVR